MDFGWLMGQVLAAAAKFPEDFRNRHGAYLLASESPQGGFTGRAGRADPYYTAFGLASLALVGRLTQPIVQRALNTLFASMNRSDDPCRSVVPPDWRLLTLAELVGLVVCGFFVQGTSNVPESSAIPNSIGQDPFSRWGLTAQQVVREFLSLVLRPDGGYAKHPASPTSSTYATFLAALLQQLVGLPLEQPDKTTQMLLDRQRDDGGFAEWPLARQSGTNPTAAAVAWWSMAGGIPASVRERAAAFLARMQSAEGGFCAHGGVPIADLLSTFTALVALELLEAGSAVDRQSARRYVASLELPTGGFRAAVWDTAADVEYTFYGLASLALLADTSTR
ncbi:MAG: prenyltransferase/squalene oxidase repeat-containing protein [Thermoguttaceae bacterium]|nr:prenyltransferase/squalene oxidase repeat-containing protein [Thermoguttaceae bacterium]